MGITEVALMWKAEMNLVLVKRIDDFVREYACRKTRNNFLRLCEIGGVKHVVVDERIVPQKCQLEARSGFAAEATIKSHMMYLVLHVSKQASD
jgi:hypothetical protein